MKAERRHELKTNTLAHGLENLPELGRQYGTKILLGIVAVLTIVVFVRYQARAARDAREQTAETFAAALSGIGNLPRLSNTRDGRAAAEQRKQIQQQASRAIEEVLEQSKDGALRADALLARGDLNWFLATSPEIPGADTQPSLKLADTDEDLLERARTAYELAANAAGASPLTVTNARLSLAAVAEERERWDEAGKLYEQIMTDARTPNPFKGEAKVRLEALPDLSRPALIGKPATAPSPALPAVGLATPTTGKATGPTTGPTTGTATTTTSPATSTAPAAPETKPTDDAAPTEPAPAEPAPKEPTEPAPAEPAPQEPTDPAPAEPAPQNASPDAPESGPVTR